MTACVGALLLAACSGPTESGGGRDTVAIPPATPLDVKVVLDETSASSQAVPLEGGTITTTGADGAVYSLTIPPEALLEETVVTMTPLASVTGAPLAGTPYGVALEPDGLRLYDLATLTIEPPAAVGPHVAGFGMRGGGQGFHLVPVAVDTAISLGLMHFSGHGAFFSEVGPILVEDPGEFMPFDWESQLQQMLAELLQRQREAELAGEPGDPDFDEKLEAILNTFYLKVIEPMLESIATDCAYAKANASKVLGWNRTVALLGKDQVFASETGAVEDAVRAGADNCWREATEPCIDQTDAEAFSEVLASARLNQLLGGDPSEYDPYDPELACEILWTGTITRTDETTVHEDEVIEGTCCYGRPTTTHDTIDETELIEEVWTVRGGSIATPDEAAAQFNMSASYERAETHYHAGWASCSGEIVPIYTEGTWAESGSATASGAGGVVIGIDEDGSYLIAAQAPGGQPVGPLSGSSTSKWGPMCEGGYEVDSDEWSGEYDPGLWAVYANGVLDPENPNVLSGSTSETTSYEEIGLVQTITVTWELTRHEGQ